MSDDAGYNEFGFTGSTTFQTPRLDALAAGGIRFTQAYVVSPVCSPSRAALLTGLYPQRFGYERNISDDLDGSGGLIASQVTLIERLHDLGYTTGVIGKWYLGGVDGLNRPLDKGADEFFGLLGGSRAYWGGATNPDEIMRRGDDPVEEPPSSRTSSSFRHSPASRGHAPRWSWRWIAPSAGCSTLSPPTESPGDTIVVFVNDNGGPQSADNSPFRGYKADTWEGGIRVPFVMHVPGWSAGVVYDRPVSVLDLVPTLLAAVGATVPSADGVNLSPYLTGEIEGDAHATLSWRFGEEWAIRDGDWKLLRTGATAPIQLFDLAADPGEENDIASQNTAIVDQLLLELTLWESKLDKPRWGVAGADDRNLFDRFRFGTSTGVATWRQSPWYREDTTTSAFMRPEDAYANAVLEFPVSAESYEAQNDMTRLTGQTFMLNEMLFTGEVGGPLDQGVSITGNAVLFAPSLSSAGPRIRLEATSAGAGRFTFDLQTNVLLLDDLEITGDGTQPAILSGAIDEVVPGLGLVKSGASEVELTGSCGLSGDLHVVAGRLALSGITPEFESITVEAQTATLEVSVGAIVTADTVEVVPGGALEGDGTVRSVTSSSGTIRPGSPVGTLAFEGSLAATGELELEIASSDPGGVDAVSVLGDATIGGALTATLAAEYVPRDGDTFEVLTAGVLQGVFGATTLPALPPPLGWSLAQDAGSVTLSIAEIPDYDGDGWANDADNCPLDPNADQLDSDSDGRGDVCDPCTDTDGDGFGNPSYLANTCPTDNCPVLANRGQEDAEPDGLGDLCDPDDDNDAVDDPLDCAPLDASASACATGTYGFSTSSVERLAGSDCP